jgi:hypothetical protein
VSRAAGPLGSLALSVVRPGSGSLSLRAARWAEGLQRLGVVLPFSVVHDVGLALSVPREQLELTARCVLADLDRHAPGASRRATIYRALLAEILASETTRRASTLRLSDELVTVVLARLLGSVAAKLTADRPPYPTTLPADASLFEGLDAKLSALFGAHPRAFELATLDALAAARLLILTLVDALDLDTLRLFGMLGSEASAGAASQVDLLAVFDSPQANDIVNFSLEILPSVLETKTHPSAGTSAAHGYAGLGTRGSIDSMMLTELAWDDVELARRLLDGEVLYYSREQARDEEKRMHLLLIDASASMRGDRQTFARGMAIATGKKLLLEGEDVQFRFFDSRLYEAQRAHNDRLPTAHLISFRSERGRNPTRVFGELIVELELLRMRDGRMVVVHLFTHAALYIPRALVEGVRRLAHIAAVFILPSGGALDLDYLDLLSVHWVVDHDALAERSARAGAARSILGETRGDAASTAVDRTAPSARRLPRVAP